jgi:hypothetical protein
MKLVIIVSFIIFAALLSSPVLAEPRLDLSVTEIDGGQVRQGELLKGVFEIGNSGDADLIIEKVQPG